MLSPEPLVVALERSGRRLTEPRLAVARLINAREGHFTAADLLDDARVRGLDIGRATVFRSLDLFAGLGLLEHVDLPGGEHAYVACRPRQHHHHVVCERCGRVAEVDDLGLDATLDEIGRRVGWQVDSHRLQLFGRCPRCRETRTGRREPVGPDGRA